MTFRFTSRSQPLKRQRYCSGRRSPEESHPISGLFKKRTIWLPTWKGWLLLALITVVGLIGLLRGLYPILAPNARVDANILIVEGWLPEYGLEAAIAEFQAGSYEHLITSGGPLWEGHHAAQLGSYAELAAHVIRAKSFPTNQLVAVPGPKVWKHRTFHSADAVRQFLNTSEISVIGINVMTLGPHGRRTKIIYDDVLRAHQPLGIISYPSAEYDKDRWWKTSEGTKHVLTETLASGYEWLFKSGRPRPN